MEILRVCEISEIPKDMQPAVRCKAYGPSSLTDDELLGIILGSGKIRKIDAAAIATKSYTDFRKAGLSDRDALKITCLGEWANRFYKARNPLEEYKSPEDVAKHLMADARYNENEWFKVLHFNHGRNLICEEVISTGDSHTCLVDIRAVYKSAIEHNSAVIIIAHNHPSGGLDPSAEDLEITRKLAEGCKTLGFNLDDHIIVSPTGYISLKERGLM